MTENMKAFLDAIKNNEELQEKVDEIEKKAQEEPEKYIDEYIEVAKEYGLTLTVEDFYPEQPDTSMMSDEELQAVTGGEEDNSALVCMFGGKDHSTDGSKKCLCAVVGAVKGCGCAVGGVGKDALYSPQ